MGAGKGYVMNWMSLRDILPLKEVVVHVDPDRFKQMMPEWPEYVRRDKLAAGSMCHKESGLLAELAQELAMDQSFNVWVDGSLRDFEWHSQKIREIRNRHPHYRIALFYVHASEATVRQRVKLRAARLGGRDVPEDVLKASLDAPAHTLRALTPIVDFVARILNEHEPVLEAFETVDTTGNWNRIADMFAFEPEPLTTHKNEGLGDRALSSTSLVRHSRSRANSSTSFSSFNSSERLDALAQQRALVTSQSPQDKGGYLSSGRTSPTSHLPAMMTQSSGDLNTKVVSSVVAGTGGGVSFVDNADDLRDLLQRCHRESRLLRTRCDDDARTIANLQAELALLRLRQAGNYEDRSTGLSPLQKTAIREEAPGHEDTKHEPKTSFFAKIAQHFFRCLQPNARERQHQTTRCC